MDVSGTKINFMRLIILSLSLIFCLNSCVDHFSYLNSDSLRGIILKSHNGVYRMQIKIAAHSKCKSTIKVFANKMELLFPIEDRIDTMASYDWYGEDAMIKVDYDSCMVGIPVIGIRFVD